MIEATSGGFFMSFDGSQVTMSGTGSSGGGTHVLPLSFIKQLEIRGKDGGTIVVIYQGGMHAHALEPGERPGFEALIAAINSARGV